MMQSFTSSATSINAVKLPRIYNTIPAPINGSIVFDYGCGRYTDHIRSAMPGVVYLPYDPFNQPAEVNRQSLYLLRLAMYLHTPVTVVCSNVLNVIDSDREIESIASRITDAVNRSGGVAYITVYEGNRSGTGCQTGPDQYQRNEPLRQYLRFFRSAVIYNRMIIVVPEKEATK